jgi:hypothetical protein
MIRSYLILFLMISAAPVQSQTVHFTFTSNTGVNATAAIPVSSHPTIDGKELAAGDEIGVFSPSGVCVGASVWTGATIGLIIWGDNQFTSDIDGIRSGEQMAFRVWQKQTNKEITRVTVVYASGAGIFAPNGLYVIASLAAVSLEAPGAPVLLAPKNGAIDVPLTPVLEWQADSSATQYLVQLSADSAFQTLIDPSIVTATQKKMPALSSKTGYYWRVRSGNAAGSSQYSSVFRFTTALLLARLPDEARVAREFRVEQNYPNPFNPETHIQFSLPQAADVTLTVYDMLGRISAVLVDGVLQSGWYTVTWNASGMGSGMYVYRLTAGTRSAAKMMLLAK